MTYQYLLNLTTMGFYRLPGVFDGHVTPAVNGSLWTIGVEASCYLGLLGVAVICRRFAGVAFAVIALGMAFVSLLLATKEGPLSALADAAPVVVYFFVGAVMKAVERQGWIRWRAAHAALALAVWWGAGVLRPELAAPGAWALLPVIVIPLGLASWPVVRAAGRFGDVSYGVYLWGFLVQQVVIESLPPLGLLANTVVILALTFAVAYLSCRVVEQPALRWKDLCSEPSTRTLRLTASEAGSSRS